MLKLFTLRARPCAMTRRCLRRAPTGRPPRAANNPDIPHRNSPGIFLTLLSMTLSAFTPHGAARACPLLVLALTARAPAQAHGRGAGK